MDRQLIKHNWKAIRGEIRKTWGILTDDELDQSNGDLKAVSELVHRNYGQKKDEIKKRLELIVETFDPKNTRQKKHSIKAPDFRDLTRH